MTIIRKAKEHLFLLLVIAAYIVLFIVKLDTGIASFNNSVFYLKEMLMIMPVIFVLTALLDVWVPKAKIMKYLGKEAKLKGIVLSLILGSISAGPIYAAFPLCIMLHKKGATVRNIVIILSSWAVIKVPMLLTELKFLGFEFMAVRWLLTVVAIIVFSWITSKIVKDKDVPKPKEPQRGLSLNEDACIGCSLCVKIDPDLFGLQNKKAYIKEHDTKPDEEKLLAAIDACPVKAIAIDED